jgi:hypothetical protein
MIAAQVLTNAQAISVPLPKTAPAAVFCAVNNSVRIAVLAIGAVSAGALAILVLVIPFRPAACQPAAPAAMLQLGRDIDNRYRHIDQ